MGVLGRLTASVAEARSVGWARCEASVDEVLDALDDGQVEITPTRRGDGPIGLLRPLSREAAHRHSLSARFGYEVLPLHTDGAHLRTPPELVLLEACRPSSSGPTLLYHFSETDLARDVLSAFRDGVFVVGAGRGSFYAHAYDKEGRLRFDPGCMKPLDPAAKHVQAWLTRCLSSASRHVWDAAGTTLVVDNRHCLHGRSAVSDQDRGLRRLMIDWKLDDATV